jgi:hypothetical protein
MAVSFNNAIPEAAIAVQTFGDFRERPCFFLGTIYAKVDCASTVFCMRYVVCCLRSLEKPVGKERKEGDKSCFAVKNESKVRILGADIGYDASALCCVR